MSSKFLFGSVKRLLLRSLKILISFTNDWRISFPGLSKSVFFNVLKFSIKVVSACASNISVSNALSDLFSILSVFRDAIIYKLYRLKNKRFSNKIFYDIVHIYYTIYYMQAKI